jgi:magnesium transporter
MPLIDNAVYRDGVRVATPASLELTFEAMKEHGGMGWMGLYRPSPEELASVAEEFDLHHLAIEDALVGHQRAKIERYGDCLFVVLRPARYIDTTEVVEFGELHIFIGPDYVITVRHAESPDVGTVRRRLEGNPALLALGPEAVLYALLDQVLTSHVASTHCPGKSWSSNVRQSRWVPCSTPLSGVLRSTSSTLNSSATSAT